MRTLRQALGKERVAKVNTGFNKFIATAPAAITTNSLEGFTFFSQGPTSRLSGPKGINVVVDAGTHAVVENSGQIDRRLTLTRVGAGAILFGPVGAVVGGLAKKKLDKRSVYVTITGDGFEYVIQTDAKHEPKARVFASLINSAI